MPGLPHYQTTTLPGKTSTAPNSSSSSTSATDDPEDINLWLPSKILTDDRPDVCQKGLDAIEERLRTAQCQDALEGVRNILKIKTRMIAFKNKNIRGQREGTRSRAVIDRVHERARNMAEKYRASRLAKIELSGNGAWEEILRTLKDEDIRGLQDADRLQVRPGRRGVLEDEALESMGGEGEEMSVDDVGITLLPQQRTRRDGTGETRRTMSWIWTTSHVASMGDKQDDILRAEWSKSRARATRTWEEVLRLKEEMRRVLETLEWKSRWWKECLETCAEAGKDVREGLKSYALRQSAMQLGLAEKFRELWKSPLTDSPEELGILTGSKDVDCDDDDEGSGEEGEGDAVPDDDEDL